MQCSHPPELSDAQLLAYIDAPSYPPTHTPTHSDVRAHLDQCAACAKRAAELAEGQQILQALLFRVDCPSADELGEYHLGLLAAERVQSVRQHVALCPHCAQEVRTLQGFLAAVALPATRSLLQTLSQKAMSQIFTQVTVWVAQLKEGAAGFSTMGGSLALEGVRGEEAKQLVYEINSIQIVMEVENNEDTPDHSLGRKQVIGLITGLEPTLAFAVELFQAEQLLLATPITKGGNFTLANLLPGTYQLHLVSSQLEIHLQNVTI